MFYYRYSIILTKQINVHYEKIQLYTFLDVDH